MRDAVPGMDTEMDFWGGGWRSWWAGYEDVSPVSVMTGTPQDVVSAVRFKRARFGLLALTFVHRRLSV